MAVERRLRTGRREPRKGEELNADHVGEKLKAHTLKTRASNVE